MATRPRGGAEPSSVAKRPRTDELRPLSKAEEKSDASTTVYMLSAELEARSSPQKGNGIFARTDLPAGWMWQDHPVCVPSGKAEPPVRRLPGFDEVDELMEEVFKSHQHLLRGPWRMSHVSRHLAAQETTEAELPYWATQSALGIKEYNLLAAMLQSQVCREEKGDSLVLLPRIRLANHACNANTELAYAPELDPERCACGFGNYVLRTLRDVKCGEEVTFSYIGTSMLMGTEDCNERRQLLQRRWDFMCGCALCRAQATNSVCSGSTSVET